MKIELKRTFIAGGAIDGTLRIDSRYFCDTVEHDPTALPVGHYRIVRHFCKQYKRYMPLIVSDPYRQSLSSRCEHCTPLETISYNTLLPGYCPMLKPGNGVNGRTDGSIILGTQIVPGCLGHPSQAFELLAERIRKAGKKTTDVSLIITES